jgi:hypothetical protein
MINRPMRCITFITILTVNHYNWDLSPLYKKYKRTQELDMLVGFTMLSKAFIYAVFWPITLTHITLSFAALKSTSESESESIDYYKNMYTNNFITGSKYDLHEIVKLNVLNKR